MEPSCLNPKVMFDDVDISFNPNTENLNLSSNDHETSNRRKVSVDLVWRNLRFTVPKKPTKPTDNHQPSQSSQPQVDDPEAQLNTPSPPASSSTDPKPTIATESESASEKVILHGINGYVRAGTMLAVMGSSGAGKTSLLNLLAGRINSSKGAHASGEVLVNGEARDYQQFKKLAAYVLQDDNMFAELTVEEQLTYAALLRLPSNMSKERKLLRVSRVIQELGLSKVRETMIGNDMVRGISGGEKKRVNIGTELVTDPSLLFLDEPTTGLDSFNALNVMLTLRQLASNGRTIVSTIHQPRSSIFALFDQLCLLSEGRVMYFGPAQDAVDYFSRLDFRPPANFNPADFFLDLLSIDPRSEQREASTKARVHYLGDKFLDQEKVVEPTSTVPVQDVEAGSDPDAATAGAALSVELKSLDYQTSWANEFSVLCGRALKLAFRERAANVARLLQNLFFAVLLGLIWLRKGDDGNGGDNEAYVQSISGNLFFIVINQAFGGAFSVIFGFPLERSVVTRERSANTYRTSSYYLSKSLTDAPKTLFFNSLFAGILYWMVGLRANAGAFFIFIVTIFLISSLSEALAMSVSILAGDAQAAAAVIPVFVIIALLFGGFFLGVDQLDDWIGWLKYTSFVYYGFNTLVKNQFDENLPQGFNDFSVGGNIAMLILIYSIYRILGYVFLHFLRGPKFLKF